jgi:hypothetical protein
MIVDIETLSLKLQIHVTAIISPSENIYRGKRTANFQSSRFQKGGSGEFSPSHPRDDRL